MIQSLPRKSWITHPSWVEGNRLCGTGATGLSHSRSSSPHIEDIEEQQQCDLYAGEHKGTSSKETFWMLVPGEDRKDEGSRDTEVQ